MKHFTILFTAIVAFCFGVAAGRYYFIEKAQSGSPLKAVTQETRLNPLRSVSNQGPVRPEAGHRALGIATAKEAESMEGYIANVLEDVELQRQDIDLIMNHPLSDTSQSQSEPTSYELRREYEVSLLDAGFSRAEAADMADNFFEYINLVNESVEKELRESYEHGTSP